MCPVLRDEVGPAPVCYLVHIDDFVSGSVNPLQIAIWRDKEESVI